MWKSLPLPLLIESAALVNTLKGKTSYLAASLGIGGFEGPLYRWTVISCLGSDESSFLLVHLTNSRSCIGFSMVWCSCVIMIAILCVCYRPYWDNILQSKLFERPCTSFWLSSVEAHSLWLFSVAAYAADKFVIGRSNSIVMKSFNQMFAFDKVGKGNLQISLLFRNSLGNDAFWKEV